MNYIGNAIHNLSVSHLRDHPQAHLVPEMRPEEYEQLIEDIRQNGIQTPLHTMPQPGGPLVLDGRHRLRAARELELDQLPCLHVDLESEDDQVLYMIRAAVTRRHLSDDQRAALAEELRTILSEQAQSAAGQIGGQQGGRGNTREARVGENDSGNVPESFSEAERQRLFPKYKGPSETPPEQQDVDSEYDLNALENQDPQFGRDFEDEEIEDYPMPEEPPEDCIRNLLAAGRDISSIVSEVGWIYHLQEEQIREVLDRVLEEEPAPVTPDPPAPTPDPPKKRDTRREAAEAYGLPPESRKLRDASKLRKTDPEKFEDVKAGRKTLREAKKELRQEENQQKLEQAAAVAQDLKDSDELLGRLVMVDTLVTESWSHLITGQEVDLVLTDPPYGRSKSHLSHTDREDISSDFGEWDGRFNVEWLELLPWVLNPTTGQALIFCPLEEVGNLEERLQKLGLHYRQALIWHKTNPPPAHRSARYMHSVEAIVWATMSERSTDFHFLPWENAGAREAHNMLEGPRCAGHERTIHPTQKPLWLIERLLQRHATPGQLVMDPFAGVASTCHACELFGCRYFAIEKDPTFFTLGMDRLGQVLADRKGEQ